MNRGQDGACTGALLKYRGLGKTLGVSLNLRLTGGASWPCSEQRGESRRNKVPEGPRDKDLGASEN